VTAPSSLGYPPSAWTKIPGTDENVFTICHGNRIDIVDRWYEDDTMQDCEQFIKVFEREKSTQNEISGIMVA
jgi:hypothetical protein